MVSAPTTIERYRQLARELLTVACVRADGRTRRKSGDPTFDSVTEMRGSLERSSVDLASWLLYRLGVRSDYLRRSEHRGWSKPVGEYLADWPVIRVPTESSRYECGDILRIGVSPHDHVIVVLEFHSPVIHSAEYTHAGGDFVNRTLSHRFGVPHLGGLRIGSWVPLEAAIDYSHSRGELSEPDVAALDQWCDTRA